MSQARLSQIEHYEDATSLYKAVIGLSSGQSTVQLSERDTLELIKRAAAKNIFKSDPTCNQANTKWTLRQICLI